MKNQGRPQIICLCGSTRFVDAFAAVNERATLDGHIVLTVAVFKTKRDGSLLTAEDKARLNELHIEKIRLADEVLIVNPDGYLGDGTRDAIASAEKLGKRVRYLHPVK